MRSFLRKEPNIQEYYFYIKLANFKIYILATTANASFSKEWSLGDLPTAHSCIPRFTHLGWDWNMNESKKHRDILNYCKFISNLYIRFYASFFIKSYKKIFNILSVFQIFCISMFASIDIVIVFYSFKDYFIIRI